MFENSRRIKPMAEINVVPYIDVMLVLLVIFMITAPILTQGITVNLPQVQSDTITPNDSEPIILSINGAGEYFLNINTLPTAPISNEDLLLKVAAQLTLAKEEAKDSRVFVKGDKDVSYGKIVTAMSLLKQAGALQVGLLTADKLNENTG